MIHRMRNPWLLVLAASPWILSSQGCHRTVDEVPLQDDVDNGSATDAGSSKRPAELELCDACDGPAPGAPNYQCKDGSTGGPVCAKKDLGDCGWLFRACPEEDDQGDASQSCGGLRGTACPKGEYCQFDESCGAADQSGRCAPKPDACPSIYTPVCGCDGKTYPNACGAAAEGISVVSKGECKSDGGGSSFCGGIANRGCPKGEYCLFDASCGAADQGGLCTTIPQGCTKEYLPVCGCDGKTYGNACIAGAAGVSVARDGTCDDGQPCSSCKGPAPALPTTQCADGSIAGPSCVAQPDTGMCGWVIRQCPVISRDPCKGFTCKEGSRCIAPADAPMCVSYCAGSEPLKEGSCWLDSDCKVGSCKGASCCPPNALCIVEDRPGTCG